MVQIIGLLIASYTFLRSVEIATTPEKNKFVVFLAFINVLFVFICAFILFVGGLSENGL